MNTYWRAHICPYIAVLKLLHAFYEIYVRWVPCHHGMAHPQVADGGDPLQFWRVLTYLWS
jgi:hypothetical protein